MRSLIAFTIIQDTWQQGVLGLCIMRRQRVRAYRRWLQSTVTVRSAVAMSLLYNLTLIYTNWAVAGHMGESGHLWNFGSQTFRKPNWTVV